MGKLYKIYLNFHFTHFAVILLNLRLQLSGEGEGEGKGEVAVFSAKRWDRRNRADLIESATPCHDARVVRFHLARTHST